MSDSIWVAWDHNDDEFYADSKEAVERMREDNTREDLVEGMEWDEPVEYVPAATLANYRAMEAEMRAELGIADASEGGASVADVILVMRAALLQRLLKHLDVQPENNE